MEIVLLSHVFSQKIIFASHWPLSNSGNSLINHLLSFLAARYPSAVGTKKLGDISCFGQCPF